MSQQEEKQQKQQQQRYIHQANTIDDISRRLQFIGKIPLIDARRIAISDFVHDHPQKLHAVLDLVPTQEEKQELFYTVMEVIDDDKELEELIQSLHAYPILKSRFMSYYANRKQDQQAVHYARTIPDEQIRERTMAQKSAYIKNRQQRLAYIQQISNEEQRSVAMYNYSLILPKNDEITLRYILSIPDGKWRSEAMAEFSKELSFIDRLSFILSIPELDPRQIALSSYADSLPFGQQRKKLIQSLTIDRYKSSAMEKIADLMPFEQRKAYLEKIPYAFIRNFKLKQHEKEERKRMIQKQGIKALQQHRRTIIIDDYEFIAISRAKPEERNYVQMISKHVRTGEITSFNVYQSNSEIGAWRYCRTTESGKMFKGVDYITITFVHFQLQEYIYSVFDSLILDTDFEECPEITKEDSEVLNSRIEKDVVFDVLSQCRSSFSCFYDNAMLLKNVASLCEDPQWTTPALQKFSQIVASNTLLENIGLLIQGMNIYLQQYLSMDISSFEPLYSYSFSISDQAFFECTIYKGSFVNLKNRKPYFMYINHYKYTNTENPAYDGVYSFITFIEPQDATITKDGVYNKVLRTGIYAYKAVEYAIQMNIYGDQKQRRKNQAIKHQRDIGWDNYYDYYFIGDIMDQFWPLSLISF